MRVCLWVSDIPWVEDGAGAEDMGAVCCISSFSFARVVSPTAPLVRDCVPEEIIWYFN